MRSEIDKNVRSKDNTTKQVCHMEHLRFRVGNQINRQNCIDYRGVNAVIDEDRFPMPRVDDILDKLGEDKVFSILDCKAGYWQLPLAKSAIPKTAFTTPFGHYEFLRLPFGLREERTC